MSATFGTLVDWLSRQRGFPRPCALAFAALLAQYGQRLDRPAHEDELRSALTKYLDAAHEQNDDTSDPVVNAAEQLLIEIDTARGGVWLFEVAPTGARRASSIRVGRGAGKRKRRSLSDEAVFRLLGTFILATECKSEAAAVDAMVAVLETLGFRFGESPHALKESVNRAKHAARRWLGSMSTSTGLTPAGVRAAYEQRAAALPRDRTVWLPRPLPA